MIFRSNIEKINEKPLKAINFNEPFSPLNTNSNNHLNYYLFNN